MKENPGSTFYEIPELRDRIEVFKDREDAGRVLSEMLAEFKGSGAIVLALPAGGVPVGAVIAERLGLSFDLLIVSKILLPWTTEAGYGALAFDGTVLLNDRLVKELRLTEDEVRAGIERTRKKVEKRSKRFRRGRPFPPVDRGPVIVVDDGLASGFTMRTAVKTLRKRGAKDIIVAVPTASLAAAEAVSREVEGFYCANIRSGRTFAVADAFVHWYDLEESEVERMLERLRQKQLYQKGGDEKEHTEKHPVNYKGCH